MSLNDALRELFLVDQQVRGLSRGLDSAKAHARGQQAKIDQLNRQLTELSGQLRQTQATEQNFENDANAIDARINRLREQMNSAKTNKEYSAFLVEVNTLKADKAKIDERALELLGQIDTFKAKIADLKTRLAEQEKIKAMADEDVKRRQAEVGDQLARLKAQRDEAASKVAPTELAIFERLADSMDEGEAMAPVNQEDPREMEFTCGGCYMSIPVERVNQLVTHDKMVRCTSCTRILYLSNEVKESMGIRS
jgi:predicted  nucleic acid-binding Zn-ribbon protein